jgi:hypothetical protein
MCLAVGVAPRSRAERRRFVARLARRTSAIALALLVLSPGTALAHAEREVEFPPGNGSVPKASNRGPSLVVCTQKSDDLIENLSGAVRERNEKLLDRCKYRSVQTAINHVKEQDSRILILPGTYREMKTLKKDLPAECEDLKDVAILEYEQQKKCPTLQNIITIFGDSNDEDVVCDNALCGLQIEGTGSKPEQVKLEGDYRRLNVLRADRADGIYLKNFTAQGAEFNAVYVLQTDGFVIDELVGRWNDEYGFLTFASDHGLYKKCEAYINGDSGVYPGAAAPHYGWRPSIEIRRCRSHHNTLGYSGTAGDSVYVHHNRFYKNGVGLVTDSFFPNHPGLPQNSGQYVNNWIYSNNKDYYKNYENGECDKPIKERDYRSEGVVCPAIPSPIGVGHLIAGGNYNVVGNNKIWNNWRYGVQLFWVPAAFREEEDPNHSTDTSHANRYVANTFGVAPGGEEVPNGTDVWWDEQGYANCWLNNLGGGDGVSSDPAALPVCGENPSSDIAGNPVKTGLLAPCATWSRENHHPPGCDWMNKPDKPEDGG